MTRTTGLGLLETDDAFAALYDALASAEPQVLVAAGDRERIENRLGTASHNESRDGCADRGGRHCGFRRMSSALYCRR